MWDKHNTFHTLRKTFLPEAVFLLPFVDVGNTLIFFQPESEKTVENVDFRLKF